MKQLLLFGLLSLLPVLGWLWIFYREHPCKKKFVIFSFFAGMLSVIPIKAYEQHWDQALLYLEHINLFRHIETLTHSPEISHLFAFILGSVIVAILFFAFVFLLMFLYEVLTGDNTIAVFRKKSQRIIESPLLFVTVGGIIGILAFYLSEILHSKIWFFVIVGMLEEFTKHLFVRFSDEEKIKSIADAISFSIAIALGFAFVENLLYFMEFNQVFTEDFSNVAVFIVLRSIFPVLGHVCFSAILGYFYGVAKFSKNIIQQEPHPILKKLHRILGVKTSTIFHEEKMLEGLLFAMILHAIFNTLLEFEQMTLIVFFLGALFWWVHQSLHWKKSLLIYLKIPRIY